MSICHQLNSRFLFSLLPPAFDGDSSDAKVAFTAERADSYSRRAVTQIRFERTVTDIGYGWNRGTNQFECYYPGVYVFAFTALSTENSQFRWV